MSTALLWPLQPSGEAPHRKRFTREEFDRLIESGFFEGHYAAAGVPEYWILDLGHRLFVVHREPSDTGYRWTRLFAEHETVTLENRTETVRVSDLLPTE